MPRTPLDLDVARTVLVIVDVQRYYLDPAAPFVRYFQHAYPGLTDYFQERCRQVAIPNAARLLEAFRRRGSAVAFLRLCGSAADRSDLHPSFRQTHQRAEQRGFPEAYPLSSDPFSEVVPELAPRAGEEVVCKGTYSPFTSTRWEEWLRRASLHTLVMAGLVTSMCVETTARDAADRGFQVVHAEDAQADYEEMSHRASLYSSQGVCGGHIYSTDWLLEQLDQGPRGGPPIS